MVDDKELLELVEVEVRELLSSTSFRGQDPDRDRQRAQGAEGEDSDSG